MIYISGSNGFKIPAVGLGTWQAPKGEVLNAVKAAIDVGYRHIDCAFLYANETEVGEAIATKIRDGKVRRQDLFVTGKLWNSFHKPDMVKPACKKTMDDLKLDYLDLFLMHWPMAFADGWNPFPTDKNGAMQFSDVDYLDTWKAMEQLVDQGLVKAIGVSNFNREQLTRLLANCRIQPACLQAESSAYLLNRRLFEFAQSRGLATVGFSPLGCPTRPWAKPGDPQLLQEPLLVTVGAKYGKTPAQVLLRFQIERGIGVIPKSVRPERLRENFSVFDFSLTKEEVDQISGLNNGIRAVGVAEWSKHKYYPFNEPM